MASLDLYWFPQMGKEIILVAQESELQGTGGNVLRAAHTWFLKLPSVPSGFIIAMGFLGNERCVRIVIL